MIIWDMSGLVILNGNGCVVCLTLVEWLDPPMGMDGEPPTTQLYSGPSPTSDFIKRGQGLGGHVYLLSLELCLKFLKQGVRFTVILIL